MNCGVCASPARQGLELRAHLLLCIALLGIQIFWMGSITSVLADCSPFLPPPMAYTLLFSATAAKLPRASSMGAICHRTLD